MDVAVLGMGRMGSALAGRLLGDGHRVAVWNRSPGRPANSWRQAPGGPHRRGPGLWVPGLAATGCTTSCGTADLGPSPPAHPWRLTC